MTCSYFIAYRYAQRGYVTDGNTVVEQADPIVNESQLRLLEQQLASSVGVPPESLGIVNLVLLDRRDG